MIETLLHVLLSGTRVRLFQAVAFGALESCMPAVREQRMFRRGLVLDAVYSYLVPILIYPAVFPVIQLLGRVAPDLGTRAIVGQQSLIVQVALAVVVGDFVAYWKHRLLHTRLLWPFHAVHHGSVEVDWLSNERVHPVESVLNAVLQAGALLLLGFEPRAIALAVVTRQTYSAYTHANARISYGRLGWLFVSPRHHRWHHSDDDAMANRNFANIFAIFDVAFGTRALRDADPTSFGVRDGGLPDGLLLQMLTPFRTVAHALRGRSAAVATPPAPSVA